MLNRTTHHWDTEKGIFKRLRGCDYCSIFGRFAVARTCYRTAGEPGIFPLDAQAGVLHHQIHLAHQRPKQVPAGRVPPIGAFHLHALGPAIGQQLGAVGAGVWYDCIS